VLDERRVRRTQPIALHCCLHHGLLSYREKETNVTQTVIYGPTTLQRVILALAWGAKIASGEGGWP